MTLTLYYLPESPPARAVLLTMRALGLEPNIVHLDLFNGKQFDKEYLKMNPQHKVPFLIDGDFKIGESRAIQIYLMDKYSKDDSLYPKDPEKRALVNHRLFYDCGTIFPRFIAAQFKIMFQDKRIVTLEERHDVVESISILNTLIGDNDWVAGGQETIADHSIIAMMSTYEVSGFDLSSWPNVVRWMENCKKNIKAYTEVDDAGVQKFGAYITKAFADKGFKWV